MKRHCLWRGFVGFTLTIVGTAPVWAADPFYLNIDVSNGSHFEQGYSSVEDAIDTLDLAALQQHVSYTGSEGVSAGFYLRGIDAALAFAVTSPTLTFQVPLAGIDTSFTGQGPQGDLAAQRANAIDQLKDYLKKNKDALRKLLTALAQHSPVDPLAGNPDSLFSQRMRNDFNYGFTNKVSQIWGCSSSAFNFSNDAPIQVAAVGGVSDIFADAQARAAALQAQNEIGLGILASSTSSKVAADKVQPGGTMTTNELTLPFSYTVKLDSDPRKKIRFDLPLTYVTTEGATSYSLGAGLAYTHPLSDVWSLTPAVGFGATGSQDLGAAGGVAAYSLTSAYTWRFDTMALSMGNAVGRYQSVGLKIGDYEAEADINNTVFTNGFLLTGPNSLIARNMVVEYSIVDTRITGDAVYSNAYDEIGIALGHITTEMGVIDSYTKLGLSYLIASGGPENISSIRLALTSRF